MNMSNSKSHNSINFKWVGLLMNYNKKYLRNLNNKKLIIFYFFEKNYIVSYLISFQLIILNFN